MAPANNKNFFCCRNFLQNLNRVSNCRSCADNCKAYPGPRKPLPPKNILNADARRINFPPTGVTTAPIDAFVVSRLTPLGCQPHSDFLLHRLLSHVSHCYGTVSLFRSKPNQDTFGIPVDIPHHLDLTSLLLKVGLIDTHGVHPQCSRLIRLS